MHPLGNARAHFWRVIKMANATDVDLSSALDEGRITSQAYADMITGCQGCAQVGKCDRLLAQRPELPDAPDYCVNKATFADLE